MGSTSNERAKTKYRTRRLPPAVTLVALLALAACGGGDDGDAAGGGGGGDEAPARCGETSATADEAGEDAGGETDDEAGDVETDEDAILTWGTMRAESMDPIRVGGVDYVQLNAVFDTLVTIVPETGELEPRLADDWEADEDAIRLTLREDVKFQDGTKFNADAVVFNLRRAMNSPDSNITGDLEAIDGVRAVGRFKVRIDLAEPTPLAVLHILADRPGMMASPAAIRDAGDSTAFSEHPVGSGMYEIDGEWFPRESMSVRAWDGYWDSEAQTLGGVDFTEVEPDGKVNALLSGSIDVASVEGGNVSAVEDDDSVEILVGPSSIARGLTVNPTIEPMDDVKVRQAIAHAINREAVVEALTGGYGEARCQPFAADSPAYDEELNSLHAYDPERSMELLEEAGYSDGLEFEAIIGSGATDYIQFGELLQAQLADVGIDMELEQVDRSRTLAMLYQEDAAAAAPIGGGANASLTDVFIRNYLLDGGSFNAGDVELDGVRDLLEEAGQQPDIESARPYYQDINRAVTEDLFQIIPVYADSAILGHQSYVGGLHPGHIDVDPSPELLRGVFIADD